MACVPPIQNAAACRRAARRLGPYDGMADLDLAPHLDQERRVRLIRYNDEIRRHLPKSAA